MSQAAEEAEYQERFEGMTIESKAFQVRSGKLHTTELEAALKAPDE